jgi:hypothetical protein
MARTAPSNRLNGVGIALSGRCLASQLRVKLGTMRPPTKLISISSVAMPSRLPSSAVEATPSACKWTSKLPNRSRLRAASIGRLRQFRPARISRATAARKAAGKARSRTAALSVPIFCETSIAIRPSAHNVTSKASGPPCSGIRPVQFGIAVSRNPATTAAE